VFTLALLCLPVVGESASSGTPPGKWPESGNWRLHQVTGQGGVLRDVADRAGFSLLAKERRVVGHTGCNAMSGSYERQGHAIRFGRMAATRMFCMGPPGDVEADFMRVLDVVRRWKIVDGELHLTDARGRVLARLQSVSSVPWANH